MEEHIPTPADDRLKHLNEVLRTFRLISRETDVDRMLEESCQMLTKTHGYVYAWIYLTDVQGKMIRMIQSGSAASFHQLEEKLLAGETVN